MAAFLVGNALTALAPGYGTLLVARFLSGLPHGAYFGVASLVAASLVAPHLRGRAVSSVMLGLAAAMLTGVPAATWLGQQLGWRSAYWTVVVLAAITVAAVLAVVPSSPGRPEATVRGELGALRRPQVLLTLLVGVVGFGGMFALYSYIAPVVTDVAGLSAGHGAAWCCSPTAPAASSGRRSAGGWPTCALFRSLVGALVVLGVLLAVVAARPRPGAPALFVGVFLVSVAASALAICLQMRLMETAGEAQMLGAALNHSALNLANALGAWLGGLVIAAGLGYRAPSVVGAGLAVARAACRWRSPAVLRRRERRGAGPAARPRRRRAATGCPPPDAGPRCNQAATLRACPPRAAGRPDVPVIRAFRPALPLRGGGSDLGLIRRPGLSGARAATDSAVYSGSDRGHTSERRASDPDQRAGRRRVLHRRRRTADAARPLPAGAARQGRHRRRVRHQQLRRLHRAPRRRGREELHRARRPGRRQRGHHDRGDRPAAAACTRCRRPSTRCTACSAGSAPPG